MIETKNDPRDYQLSEMVTANEQEVLGRKCTDVEKDLILDYSRSYWYEYLNDAFREWEDGGCQDKSEDGVVYGAMDDYTDMIKEDMDTVFNGGIRQVFTRDSVSDIAIDPNDERDDGTAALREMNIYATIYMEFNDDNLTHCQNSMQSNDIFKMPYGEIHKQNVEFMKEVIEHGDSELAARLEKLPCLKSYHTEAMNDILAGKDIQLEGFDDVTHDGSGGFGDFDAEKQDQSDKTVAD